MSWLIKRIGIEAAAHFAVIRRADAESSHDPTDYIARAWTSSATTYPTAKPPPTASRKITPLSTVIGIIATLYPHNAPLIPDEALTSLNNGCKQIISITLPQKPHYSDTCLDALKQTLEL